MGFRACVKGQIVPESKVGRPAQARVGVRTVPEQEGQAGLSWGSRFTQESGSSLAGSRDWLIIGD